LKSNIDLKLQIWQENTTMQMLFVCLPGTYQKKQLVTLPLTFCKPHLKKAGTKGALKKSNQLVSIPVRMEKLFVNNAL
jgi:hypothetical protein